MIKNIQGSKVVKICKLLKNLQLSIMKIILLAIVEIVDYNKRRHGRLVWVYRCIGNSVEME